MRPKARLALLLLAGCLPADGCLPAEYPNTWLGELVCDDGVDNDDDGAVDMEDEDCSDRDGDGHRAHPWGEDCDDGDASVNPDHVEWCDGKDNDCCCEGCWDGWGGYAADVEEDRDGDGWLDCRGLSTTLEDCEANPDCEPAAGVQGEGDCDDDDRNTWPGAPELCGDGIGNDWEDCEADPPEGEPCTLAERSTTLGHGGAAWSGVTTADQAGVGLGAGDVDGDGRDDLLIATRGGGKEWGWVYLVLGPSAGQHSLADADRTWRGELREEQAGDAVAIGDIDRDGYADIVVGGPFDVGQAIGPARVYVVYGGDGCEGLTSGQLDQVAGTVLYGTEKDQDGDIVFESMDLHLADLVGDPWSDLVIGAAKSGAGDVLHGGAVHILSGSRLSPRIGTLDLEEADVVIAGTMAGEQFGYAVSSGDLGDGLGTDLAVGAPWSIAAEEVGTVYLWLDGVDGSTTADASHELTGTEPGDNAGLGVAADGDVDGDGHADLLVGAPGTTSARGEAYVLLGGRDWSSTHSLEEADVTILGAKEGDGAGNAVAFAGDVDADGLDDIVIGAPNNGAGGSVYLLYGRPDLGGTVDLGAKGWDGLFEAPWDNEAVGETLAPAGDVNGDGFADFLVGAHLAGADDWGTAYLVYGGEREEGGE